MTSNVSNFEINFDFDLKLKSLRFKLFIYFKEKNFRIFFHDHLLFITKI